MATLLWHVVARPRLTHLVVIKTITVRPFTATVMIAFGAGFVAVDLATVGLGAVSVAVAKENKKDEKKADKTSGGNGETGGAAALCDQARGMSKRADIGLPPRFA